MSEKIAWTIVHLGTMVRGQPVVMEKSAVCPICDRVHHYRLVTLDGKVVLEIHEDEGIFAANGPGEIH